VKVVARPFSPSTRAPRRARPSRARWSAPATEAVVADPGCPCPDLVAGAVGGARGYVEGAEVNSRAAGSTLGGGSSVLASCGWGLRPTGGAGVSSGRVGGLGGHRRSGVPGVGRRPVLATTGLGQHASATAGHSRPWCSAASPSSLRRCWSGAAVVAEPGG
jgi:hypothetical protein